MPRRIDARATRILLHTLYGPALAIRLHLPFEKTPHRLEPATRWRPGWRFHQRNHPLDFKENYDKFKSLSVMLFPLASAAALVR